MNLVGTARDSILERRDVDNTASYKGKIEIHYSEEESHGIIIVKDNGTGILVDIADRIFDPFVTSKRGQGASGLGMHLVYNLVTQALAGEIVLDTEYQSGARFIITLF